MVWAWSLVLVLVTIAVHVSGLASIAIVVPRFWRRDVSGHRSFLDTIPGTVSAITLFAFMLALLHVVEALIWATVYLRVGALTSVEDAILFSLGAMSTAGSGLNVQVQWRLMGAIESFDGLLLFGISTAFLFTMMRLLWRTVSIRGRD